jgi:glutamate formiminotransferase
VHPRVGALDVLPFVPLQGLTMADAAASAHRVGEAIAALGVPVYFYGQASAPPGRRLAELRRGGFESLRGGFPEGRVPDLAGGRTAAHPTAGATCVGARTLLLAWNVELAGLGLEKARALAAELREGETGFATLRALAFQLASDGRVQLSMNLEDMERTSPFDVFRRIEERAAEWGGEVVRTEVIGMVPDPLVLPAAADRLRLFDLPPSRLLSRRLARHAAERSARHAEARLQAVRDEGERVPARVREAALRLSATLTHPPARDREP